MEHLSYKEWIWPQNPEHYQQSYVREPVYEKDSNGDTVFFGMGPMKRTFTGDGVFFGASAYESFQELAAMFAEPTAGTLVHPIWGTYQAYLTELELTQEPKENQVAYRFTFREADGDGAIPK